MKKSTPIISIIMSTFNRDQYIREALDSIQNQTFENWECIIIDDHSTDNTAQIIKEYQEKDPRFKYIIKPMHIPKGLPASRNLGMDLAKGKYIMFVDDDDFIHQQLLEILLFYFLKQNQLDFIHYPAQKFIEGNEDVRRKIDLSPVNFEDLPVHNITGDLALQTALGLLELASCTVIWKRNLLEGDYFMEDLNYAEEREYYTRIFLIHPHSKGIKIEYPLYFYRKHPSSHTMRHIKGDTIMRKSHQMAMFQIYNDFKKYRGELPKRLREFFYSFSLGSGNYDIAVKIFSSNPFLIFEFATFILKRKLYKIYKSIKN